MKSPITGKEMVQETTYDYEDPDNKGDSKAPHIHWKDVDTGEMFTDETQEEINLYALKLTRQLHESNPTPAPGESAEEILKNYEYDVHYYGSGREDILAAMEEYKNQSGWATDESMNDAYQEGWNQSYLYHGEKYATYIPLPFSTWLSNYKKSKQ
jgi:hypothetical protein